MSRFLSKASESLLPYTPGEQPQGQEIYQAEHKRMPVSAKPEGCGGDSGRV